MEAIWRQKKSELMQELKKLEPEGMPGIDELREEQLRLKRRYYEQLQKWEIYLHQKEKYNKNGSGSPPEPPQQLAKAEYATSSPPQGSNEDESRS